MRDVTLNRIKALGLSEKDFEPKKKDEPVYIEDEVGNKYIEQVVDGAKKLILVESYDGIMNV